MLFHAYFLNSQPALTDSIKICVPGTTDPVPGTLYKLDIVDGYVAINNPFLISEVGTVQSWAFLPPVGVPYDVLNETTGERMAVSQRRNPEFSTTDLVKVAAIDQVYTVAEKGKVAAIDQVYTVAEKGKVAAIDQVYTVAEKGKVAAIDQVYTVAEKGKVAAIDKIYTVAEKGKLSNIEPGATADQSANEIKTAYESNNDTNVFNDLAAISQHVITESQFSALASANRDKFAGSGFVEWGNHVAGIEINEGMSAAGDNYIYLGRQTSSVSGTSKINNPQVNINGVSHTVRGVRAFESTDYINNIHLPKAPATATLKERQDLVFMESWHEKISLKDFVYVYGNVQSYFLIDPATGLATLIGSFTGSDTYSLFGKWQTSGDYTGRGLVWSTMTDANKKKFVSDPENNVYLAKDGELVQVRYRVRTVEGLGVDYDITDLNVYSQGENATVQINNFTIDTVDKGLYNSIDSEAIQIALVSRRNQGAFHPVFNPNGTQQFWDAATTTSNQYWYAAVAYKPLSTSDCFIFGVSGSGAATAVGWGSVGSTGVGRPDNKFYDAVYEGDVLDLRNSAHKQDLTRTLDREFNKLVAGEMRGWESPCITKSVFSGIAPAVISGYSAGGYLRIMFTVGSVDATYNTDPLTRYNPLGVGFIRGNTTGTVWKVVSVAADESGYDRVYLDLAYGAITTELDGEATFDFMITTNTTYGYLANSIKSKTLLQCDIIGDPANYPQSWKDNGVMGAHLVVGEEGEDLTPDGTSKEMKLSRKAKATPLIALYSIDSGVSWSVDTTWDTDFSTSTNSRTAVWATGQIQMVFYETEASPFEVANNAEVLKIGNVRGDNWYSGGITKHLLGKVPVSSAVAIGIMKSLNSWDTVGGKLNTSAGEEPKHDTISELYTANPTAKILTYVTREGGKLYLQSLFKEMKYDVTWGDDDKFNVVDGVTTTTDVNGNTVLIGQKRAELPYFIGDGD